MESAALLESTFAQAAEETYGPAAAAHGKSFDDWSGCYLWLAEREPEELQELEQARLTRWLELARAAGVPETDLPPADEVGPNLSAAIAVFGLDPDPQHDSAYHLPRGGERQVVAAKQLRDPLSPLYRGLDDWQDFTSDA
jgi:hypothetical protein